jgi:dTDP-4-dehydrorhamnose 3,5-epimerase
MKFTETKLKGSFIISPELLKDERGFFSRVFCREEFSRLNLNPNLVQCNLSFNKERGTLRGLHYQIPPHEEVKLVRCTAGSIFDVIVDLRPESPTFHQWLGVKLSTENHKLIYVPEGFAHGYQTLKPKTEVFYQVSEFYHPASEQGLRWDDPVFGIAWPLKVKVISEKDQSHALWGTSL